MTLQSVLDKVRQMKGRENQSLVAARSAIERVKAIKYRRANPPPRPSELTGQAAAQPFTPDPGFAPMGAETSTIHPPGQGQPEQPAQPAQPGFISSYAPVGTETMIPGGGVPEYNIPGGIQDAAEGALGAAIHGPSSIVSQYAEFFLDEDPGEKDNWADANIERYDRFLEQYMKDKGGSQLVAPGVTRSDVRGAMASLPFSGAALTGGLVGGSVGGGAGAAVGAAGAIAPLAYNSIRRQALGKLEKELGRRPTPSESAALMRMIEKQAITHAAGEVVGSAASTALDYTLLGRLVQDAPGVAPLIEKIGKTAGAAVYSFVGELGGETLTTQIQQPVEVGLGLRQGEARGWTPGDIAASAKEVAGQVAVSTGGMYSGMAAYQIASQPTIADTGEIDLFDAEEFNFDEPAGPGAGAVPGPAVPANIPPESTVPPDAAPPAAPGSDNFLGLTIEDFDGTAVRPHEEPMMKLTPRMKAKVMVIQTPTGPKVVERRLLLPAPDPSKPSFPPQAPPAFPASIQAPAVPVAPQAPAPIQALPEPAPAFPQQPVSPVDLPAQQIMAPPVERPTIKQAIETNNETDRERTIAAMIGIPYEQLNEYLSDEDYMTDEYVDKYSEPVYDIVDEYYADMVSAAAERDTATLVDLASQVEVARAEISAVGNPGLEPVLEPIPEPEFEPILEDGLTPTEQLGIVNPDPLPATTPAITVDPAQEPEPTPEPEPEPEPELPKISLAEQKKWFLDRLNETKKLQAKGKAKPEVDAEGKEYFQFDVPDAGSYRIAPDNINKAIATVKRSFPGSEMKGKRKVYDKVGLKPTGKRNLMTGGNDDFMGTGDFYTAPFEPIPKKAKMKPGVATNDSGELFRSGDFVGNGHYFVKKSLGALAPSTLKKNFDEKDHYGKVVEAASSDLASGKVIPGKPTRVMQLGADNAAVEVVFDDGEKRYYDTNYFDPIYKAAGEPELSRATNGLLTFRTPKDGVVAVMAELNRYEEGKPAAMVKERQQQYESYTGPSMKSEEPGGPAYDTDAPEKAVSDYDLFMQMPELVEFLQMFAGRLPKLERVIDKKPEIRGSFSYRSGADLQPLEGSELIRLKLDIAKDPMAALKTMAHEIGHYVDYLSELGKGTDRGNILNRLASLKNDLTDYLARSPQSEQPLSVEDIARLQAEAEAIEQGIADQDTDVVAVDPNLVLNFLRGVDPSGLAQDAADFIAAADTPTKKSIAKQAMRGLSPEELAAFKQIEHADIDAEDVQVRFNELFEEEVKRRQLFERVIIEDELKDLTMAWKPWERGLSQEYDEYRHSSVELYADAFSAFVVSPKTLEQVAPTFLKAFDAYMHRKPEVLRAWSAIQKEIAKGQGNLVEKRWEKRMVDFEEGRQARGRKAKKAAEEYAKGAISSFDWLATALHDQNWPITKHMKRLHKSGDPAKVSLAEDFMDALRRNRLTPTYVQLYLRQIRDRIMVPMAEAGIDKDTFGAIGYYRHVIANRKGMFSSGGELVKESAQQLEQRRRELGEDKYRKIIGLLRDMREIYKGMIVEPYIDLGLAAPRLAEAMRNRDDYMPVSVLYYIDKDPAVTGRNGLASGVSDLIFKQVGTLNAAENPFDAMMVQASKMTHAMFENETRTKMLAALEAAGQAEKWITGTEYNPETHEVISIKTMGDDVHYLVPKDIATAYFFDKLKPSNRWPEALNVLYDATSTFKALVTKYNPPWMVRNVFRDMTDTFQSIPEIKAYEVIPFIQNQLSVFGEIYDFAVHDKTSPGIEKIMKERLIPVQSNWNARFLDNVEDETTRLLMQFGVLPEVHSDGRVARATKALFGDNKAEKIAQVTARMDTVFQKASTGSEVWTKLATDKYLSQKNLAPTRQRKMIIERGGTPNWTQRGRMTPLFNMLFPFFNVAEKFAVNTYNAVTESPGQFAIKATMFGGFWLPALYAMALRGFMGDEAKNLIAAIPTNDLKRNVVIPFGKTEEGKTAYLKFPTPSGMIGVQGVLLDLMAGNDVPAANHFMELMSSFNPISGISPIMEVPYAYYQYMQGANHIDGFTKRNVFSDRAMTLRGETAHKEFLGWAWNKVGLGLIYKMPTAYTSKESTVLEDTISSKKFPFRGLIGISDKGLYEEFRRNVKDIRETRAEEMKARYDIAKEVNDDQELAAQAIKFFRSNGDGATARVIEKMYIYQHGNTMAKIYNTAKNDDERAIVLKMFVDRLPE